jgi:bifunctional non-homologous end joining protein LigD
MAFQRKKPAAIGIKAPLPGFIEPELATSIDKVPSGKRWIHEIKFDGFRKIAANAWHVNAGSAITDGEVVVPGENGTTAVTPDATLPHSRQT